MNFLKRMFKGWIGEKKTSFDMWLSIDNKVFKRFHNVIIPSSNGTSQLDHILVSPFGVFIIETKNKDGWIFGSEEKAKWTQVFPRKKYTFQNPLRQTYRQKKVLSEFLDINESIIKAVVYFVGDCSFRTQMPDNVLNSGLGKYVNKFSEVILSKNEENRIISKIESHLAVSNISNRDHVKSLKKRHNSKTNCPRCGNELTLRTAKKGKNAGSNFLGCSNFPNCRYSQ